MLPCSPSTCSQNSPLAPVAPVPCAVSCCSSFAEFCFRSMISISSRAASIPAFAAASLLLPPPLLPRLPFALRPLTISVITSTLALLPLPSLLSAISVAASGKHSSTYGRMFMVWRMLTFTSASLLSRSFRSAHCTRVCARLRTCRLFRNLSRGVRSAASRRTSVHAL